MTLAPPIFQTPQGRILPAANLGAAPALGNRCLRSCILMKDILSALRNQRPKENQEAADSMMFTSAFAVLVLTGSIAVDRVQPWDEHMRLTEARPDDIVEEDVAAGQRHVIFPMQHPYRMQDRYSRRRSARRNAQPRTADGGSPDRPAGAQAAAARRQRPPVRQAILSSSKK